MHIILGIFGIVELVGGVLVFTSSKSAVHEILAVLLVGFSFMTMALGQILQDVHKSEQSTAKLVELLSRPIKTAPVQPEPDLRPLAAVFARSEGDPLGPAARKITPEEEADFVRVCDAINRRLLKERPAKRAPQQEWSDDGPKGC